MKKIVSLIIVLMLCSMCFCREIRSAFLGNLDTDDVHPEACERVGRRGNGGCLHRIFDVLRVVRNHREPRDRHRDGNLENIPEAE